MIVASIKFLSRCLIILILLTSGQSLAVAASVKYKASQNLLELQQKLKAKESEVESEEQNEIRVSEPVVEAKIFPSMGDLGEGKSIALLIGINEYQLLPSLTTAVDDVESIAGILSDDYGFTTKEMFNPTRNEIIKELSKLRSEIESNDKLLIYFAGHGWLDEEADEGYWLPIDAERSNPANWISNSMITTYLRAIRARHLLVIADSCYSGTLTRGLDLTPKRSNYFERVSSMKSRTVITSGGLEPVTDSGGTGNHSIFASAMMKTLNQNDGVIDAPDLFASMRGPVAFNSDQVPQFGVIHKAGHEGGEFFFIRNKR